MKLKPQIKTQWIANLRGDKYKQGRSYLCVIDETERHCCMGVLCDMLQVKWSSDTVFHDGMDRIVKLYNFPTALGATTDRTGLPGFDWFRDMFVDGLQMTNDEVAKIADHLAEMNDRGKATFEQIAEYIEENL